MNSISNTKPNWDALDDCYVWSDTKGMPYFYVGVTAGEDGQSIPICVKVVNSSLQSQYTSGVTYRTSSGKIKTANLLDVSETSWDKKVIKAVMQHISDLEKTKGLSQDFADIEDLK